MACKCAPCLVNLRTEINKVWPKRDKASDGCCGDAAHAARTSDHNPTNGYAHALDIDEDLTPGGGHMQLEWLRERIFDHPAQYPQVKYLIYEREIWYPHDGARKRGKYAYTGPNAHEHHLHVSIFTTHTNYSGTWLAPHDPPAPVPQEDEMRPFTITNGKMTALAKTDGMTALIYETWQDWEDDVNNALVTRPPDGTPIEKYPRATDRQWERLTGQKA